VTILNDIDIRDLAAAGMITPFEPELVRELDVSLGGPFKRRLLSYGCSSYGYDLRLSPKEFWVFRHIPGTIVDPKAFNSANLAPAPLYNDPLQGDYFVLPAHSYGLGVALERLCIPEDVTALFLGKSTYARCGVIANLTPGEAGWKGHLTLEFSNSAGADCRIYANEGIVQAVFFKGEPCATSYAARAGKYQNQEHGVVTARI
jgi:dCTP deaminase